MVSLHPHLFPKLAAKAPLRMLDGLGLTIRMPDLADEFH